MKIILIITTILGVSCTFQHDRTESSNIHNDTLTTNINSTPIAELNDSTVNYIVNAETNIETIGENRKVNPRENFAAVMVCSEATEDCPFVPGTELRIPLTYEDPKIADDAVLETEKYDERNHQIATEMLFEMLQVKEKL